MTENFCNSCACSEWFDSSGSCPQGARWYVEKKNIDCWRPIGSILVCDEEEV
jgi:hypothetical protein